MGLNGPITRKIKAEFKENAAYMSEKLKRCIEIEGLLKWCELFIIIMEFWFILGLIWFYQIKDVIFKNIDWKSNLHDIMLKRIVKFILYKKSPKAKLFL